MAARKAERKEARRVLSYVIEDYLEIKASVKIEDSEPLKRFLLSRSSSGEGVSPVEGFLLADNLVLFDRTNPQTVQNLVFVCPGNGRMQVRPLLV